MKTSTKITLGAIAAVSALYVGGIAPVAMPSGIVGSAYATTAGVTDLTFSNGFTPANVEYNATNNIYTVAVNASLANLNTILNYKPANGQAVAYAIGFKLGGEWNDVDSYSITNYATSDPISTDSEGTVWTPIMDIEYWDADSEYWFDFADLSTTGNGETSIRQFIASATGENIDELKYGVDYRVKYLPDSQTFKYTDNASADALDPEYVTFNFSTILPTSETGVLYPTIEAALEAEDVVILNTNTIINNTLEIPAGKALKLANNKLTIILGENGKIKANAGAIKNANGKSIFNAVAESWTDPVTNITSTVTNNYLLGQEVKFTAEDRLADGFTRTITVTGLDADEESGKYIMTALSNTTQVSIQYEYYNIAETILPADEEDRDEIAGSADYSKLASEIAESVNDTAIKELLDNGNNKVKISFEVESIEADDSFLAEIGGVASAKLATILGDIALEDTTIYDVTLWATGVQDGEVRQLTELAGKGVTVAIKLPDTENEYKLIRIHGDEVEVIPAEVADGYLVFTNNQFSYFVLANTGTIENNDDEKEENNENNEENNEENEEETKLPSIVKPETPAATKKPETGAFTNVASNGSTESHSSSIVAAIAAIAAVAVAGFAKLFKKADDEQ